MMKRIIALVLSLVLVVAVLPLQGVNAAPDSEVQQVMKEIRQHYYRTLAAAGKTSLHGWCGLLASYQLYFLGINREPIMADGKDQYNIYAGLNYTETGFAVKTYSAYKYTLEDALNAASRGGTRDVYNILVGFQSTSTAAGSVYGHAMVIYAILDGIVYFTESFPCTVVSAEGAPSACTIEEFCDYYNRWTRFEGIVVFGNKDYADRCAEYNSHMYVQSQASNLYSQPCAPGTVEEAASKLVRPVSAGERLLVTNLYKNTLGQFYYQVDDSGTVCYLPAEAAAPIRFQFEDITVMDAVLPDKLQEGKKFNTVGEVTASRSWMDGMRVVVYDQNGNAVLSKDAAKPSGMYNLKKDLNPEFHTLSKGAYTYELWADAVCYYIENGQLTTVCEQVQVCSVPFTVGDADSAEPDQGGAEASRDGWFWEQGTWYYFENGMPRSGWFCYDGVDYYLQEDGSVTIGWAEINGKPRFFSSTGAMRTGWLKDTAGTYYLLSNGEPAHGWRTIEDKLYYFGETGVMHPAGWITIGDEMFYMKNDGSTVTGWVTMNDGDYYFSEEDGHLMAQAVTKNGETVFRAYDPAVGSLTDLPTLNVQNAATATK